MTYLHFAHSPLIEAVIDIQVVHQADVKLEAFAQLPFDSETYYSPLDDVWRLEGEFHPDTDQPVTSRRIKIGMRYISQDELQLCLATMDGLTFSRLQPYQSWSIFVAEARRLWDIYRTALQPKAITRCAVRYINRLDIPLPISNLGDFLTMVPGIHSHLKHHALSGFFSQLQIPQPDIEAMLVLTQTPTIAHKENMISVILDIDIARETNIPDTEDMLWAYFEQLRERKNEIFLASTTEKMQELFRI